MKLSENFKTKQYLIAHLVLLVTFCILAFSNIENLASHYAKVQSALFTGFLTVGGFLLSIKTFILVKMREDLYDSKEYLERYAKKVIVETNLKLYAPLRRLGDFLVYCVICALVTAILQVTIGFLPYQTAKAICLSAAFFTLTLVILAWWQIKLILNDWFDLLDNRTTGTTDDTILPK